MGISKYKYYFRKPKSEIVKDIFKTLLFAGAISVAYTSPFFIANLLRSYRRWKAYPRRKVYDAFSNLSKQGYIKVSKRGQQIHIELTGEGKKKAGWLQINSLDIQKPEKWDKRWRLVAFDIIELKKKYREAFRGKLKELGFYQLQKSVWIYPYNCSAEIDLLRDFFGLNKKELRLIISDNIGPEDEIREKFDLF